MSVNRTYLVRPGMRLWPRLRIVGRCLEWSGTRNAHGYGSLRVDGRLIRAHRYAWQLCFGPIPDGLDVCHHCDNPPCCNPAHLFLGSASDNGMDMSAKGRHGSRTRPDRVAAGERHGSAKLTVEDVLAIRAKAHIRSVSSLAREYGVVRSTIRSIRDEKTWKGTS